MLRIVIWNNNLKNSIVTEIFCKYEKGKETKMYFCDLKYGPGIYSLCEENLW